jgi:hypothetical protein
VLRSGYFMGLYDKRKLHPRLSLCHAFIIQLQQVPTGSGKSSVIQMG